MAKHDVSFVKNQPQIHPIGFNPISEQWMFAVLIAGERFDYSGGLWAFVPAKAKRRSSIHRDPETGAWEVEFSPREHIKKFINRNPNSRLAATFRNIEQGRIKISKNWNDRDVRGVVSLIGAQNRPEAASVFYSLLSDMDAGEISFHDFCMEFGANEDSIKDLSTHQACQVNARKFRSVVSREEIEKLREVLQDY